MQIAVIGFFLIVIMAYLSTDRPTTLLLQLVIGMFFSFFSTALSIMFHVQKANLWELLMARRQ